MDWKIQHRSAVCQACGRAYADQEPYHTLLFEGSEGYRRFDVCAACWENQHKEAAAFRKGFVSYWQGVYQVPPPAPPEPVQRETAESLLRQVAERKDPRWQGPAFILAAMLERKRLLKVKSQTRREGRRIFIYEHPKTGDVFAIADPELRLNQLTEVQRQVARLLEHGLEVLESEDGAVNLDGPGTEAGFDQEPVQGGEKLEGGLEASESMLMSQTRN